MTKQLNEKPCSDKINPGNTKFGKIELDDDFQVNLIIEEKEVKPLQISTIKNTKDSSAKSLF